MSMKRLDHGSDVVVLENLASAVPCSPKGNIHHGPPQVVGPNHLVGEERPKRGVDRAQEAVAEIWFLPRLHRVDVRGPGDVKAREPRRESGLLGLSLIACETHPAPPGRVPATPTQK